MHLLTGAHFFISRTFRSFKWDVIKSILKSAAGWQARKLAELQIPSYGAEESAALEALNKTKGGLRGMLGGLTKKKKVRGAAAFAF